MTTLTPADRKAIEAINGDPELSYDGPRYLHKEERLS